MTAGEDRRPSTAIISLVADVNDADPVALEPLYNAIDPDTLNSICDPHSGFRNLSFDYEGWTVTVAVTDEDDGVDIVLEEAADPNTDATGVLTPNRR